MVFLFAPTHLVKCFIVVAIKLIIKLAKRDAILKYDRLYFVNYFLIYLTVQLKRTKKKELGQTFAYYNYKTLFEQI